VNYYLLLMLATALTDEWQARLVKRGRRIKAVYIIS